jgi:hypothetical protein
MRNLKFAKRNVDRWRGRKWNRPSVIAVAVAATLGATAAISAAPGAGASVDAVTFTGSIAHLPAGTGRLLVEAEVPSHIRAHHVPGLLTDLVVAAENVGAGRFSVAVPESSALAQAEKIGNGWVNFRLIVVSGHLAAAQYVPAALTAQAAQGNVAAAAQSGHRTAQVPAFRGFRPISPALSAALANTRTGPGIIPPCLWIAVGSQVEDATRIGEVHVDRDSGSTDTFTYVVQADSNITVGISYSTTGGSFSTSGSVQISNHFSGTGSFPNGPGTLIYANGHFYYQQYNSNGAPGCGGVLRQVRAVSAVGDAFQGFRQPAANPYGGCLSGQDPYGYAEADTGGGTFDSDRGTALSYSGIANLFGFQFGGSTGFSNDIYQDYTNNSAYIQYYCGTGYMPNVAVIYNADQ